MHELSRSSPGKDWTDYAKAGVDYLVANLPASAIQEHVSKTTLSVIEELRQRADTAQELANCSRAEKLQAVAALQNELDMQLGNLELAKRENEELDRHLAGQVQTINTLSEQVRTNASLANDYRCSANQRQQERNTLQHELESTKAKHAELKESYERRGRKIDELDDTILKLKTNHRDYVEKQNSDRKKKVMERFVAYVATAAAALVAGFMGGGWSSNATNHAMVEHLRETVGEQKATLTAASDYIKAVQNKDSVRAASVLNDGSPGQIQLEEPTLSADTEQHMKNLSMLLGAKLADANDFGVSWRTSNQRAYVIKNDGKQHWYHVSTEELPFCAIEIGSTLPDGVQDDNRDITLQGKWQQITPTHSLYHKYRSAMAEKAAEAKVRSMSAAQGSQVPVSTDAAISERVADVRLRTELEAAKLRIEAADIRAEGERNLRAKISNQVDALELELTKNRAELDKALTELKQLQSSASAEKVTTRE
jgi:hypothetical protein